MPLSRAARGCRLSLRKAPTPPRPPPGAVRPFRPPPAPALLGPSSDRVFALTKALSAFWHSSTRPLEKYNVHFLEEHSLLPVPSEAALFLVEVSMPHCGWTAKGEREQTDRGHPLGPLLGRIHLLRNSKLLEASPSPCVVRGGGERLALRQPEKIPRPPKTNLPRLAQAGQICFGGPCGNAGRGPQGPRHAGPERPLNAFPQSRGQWGGAWPRQGCLGGRKFFCPRCGEREGAGVV